MHRPLVLTAPTFGNSGTPESINQIAQLYNMAWGDYQDSINKGSSAELSLTIAQTILTRCLAGAFNTLAEEQDNE